MSFATQKWYAFSGGSVKKRARGPPRGFGARPGGGRRDARSLHSAVERIAKRRDSLHAPMRACPQCGTACDDSHKFCPGCGFPVGKVASNVDDPLIGRTLPGGYVILELVGIGGMGRVYRAEQSALGRTVAVKIIHPHLVGEENAAARFITEARAASRLNHPNSVAVIDFGKTPDGQLYLVMEFLRGRDLARVAYDEGPLAFRRIVSILRQVLAALAEAHHLDIIHRDLKPENVILEPMRSGGDFVKVVDFGLAKMRAESEKPSITSPGIVCGTPEYMSPEQGRGDPLDARSDLYAVGVIFYQLLTGRLPFEAESPTQVVLMHLTKPPTDPRTLAPEREIPAALADVALLALAKDPKHRFSNADEFSEALADSLAQVEGQQTAARGPATLLTKCPSCGAMNASNQKFCGECGASVMAAAQRPSSVVEPPLAVPSLAVPKRGGSVAPARKASTDFPPEEVSGSRLVLDGDRIRFPLPLVGREDDLLWLEDRRNDAKSTLSGARVVGEPGIGKTRLLREFLIISAAAGDTVVVTGPDPVWAEVGYYALRRAIRSLAQLPENGGSPKEWGAPSAEARRGLLDVFSIDEKSRGSLSSDDRRFTAAEALRWALTKAAERSPKSRVILAIDDLHQIDGASRNAFSDAISEPPLVPALMVVTYAPGFDPLWPASAPSRVLSGLPPPVVAKLLRASGSGSSPSLAEGSRGIAPLYLDQLLRYTREQGGAAPARLADLIALRVERLPPLARRVLQAIAVYGDNATPDSLKPLLPDTTDVADGLKNLELGAMIEAGPDGYRTSHPLLREVVLATIPAAVRRGLHAYAADYCEETGAPAEVRAWHEYQAQNSFQALILLESVSARCAARGDIRGTVTSLRRGLELARRELFRGELDDPMRAVLIFSRKLGEALAVAGDLTDAEGVLREALDIAGPSGKDRASVLGALATVANGREKKNEARLYLREAMELAFESGAHELLHSLEDLKRSIAV
jgi:serine/threonine protein kinase